jgi:hypothetical protein
MSGRRFVHAADRGAGPDELNRGVNGLPERPGRGAYLFRRYLKKGPLLGDFFRAAGGRSRSTFYLYE